MKRYMIVDEAKEVAEIVVFDAPCSLTTEQLLKQYKLTFQVT